MIECWINVYDYYGSQQLGLAYGDATSCEAAVSRMFLRLYRIHVILR